MRVTDLGDDELRRLLPAELAEIAIAIDLAAALIVMRRLGGVRVFCPESGRPGPDNRLTQELGAELAGRIAALWPGNTILVPMARSHKPRLVEYLLGLGWSVEDVALAAGVHRKTVYDHKAVLEGRRQLALFPGPDA